MDKYESFFNEHGVKMLTEYINYKAPIIIECHEGHKTKITFNNAKLRSSRGVVLCKECAKNSSGKILKDKIVKLLVAKNYTLLSDEVSYESKFKYTCSNNHINEMSISNLMNGKGCPECYGNKVVSCEVIRDSLNTEGYQLVDTNVSGVKTKFKCKCANGHVYSTSYDNWKNKGRRCPTCVTSISKLELEVLTFIKSIYDGDILTNNRSIIAPRELDIVLPDLNIAVEFCGLYWHSELSGKNRSYHRNKLNSSIEGGYRLLTIFEDEWLLKKDIVKSRLMAIINRRFFNKVYARKCIIKEVPSKLAKKFCEDNHLQGYGAGASIKLGAYFNNELVSLMTFSKPSVAKGIKTTKEFYKVSWELHRFCSKLNYNVIGVASKILKYFEKNYDWSILFSFADRRWSDGGLYRNLDFEFEYYTEPNYWYFKDTPVRHHRFSLRKNKNDIQELSEWQNRIKQGYDRIWDCGNIKYIKYNKLTII